jgi:hypothetical protein
MELPDIPYNLGFEGRMFLTKAEWDTYRRRKPVRFIRGQHAEFCSVCNKPAEEDNPFQHAHRIGFEIGVIYLGLTPDYVDSHPNIVTAHKRKCNRESELTLLAAMKSMRDAGVTSLPDYLPAAIHGLWKTLSEQP